MTIRYLLDTNIVSAPAAKHPDQRVVDRIEAAAHESAIASPVWHELNFGIGRLPSSKRKTALASYVADVVGASFEILPYDEVAAAWHARERVRLSRRGIAVPHVDAQIAAIAHVNGLIFVTKNARDFTSFEGLEVEDWSQPASGT